MGSLTTFARFKGSGSAWVIGVITGVVSVISMSAQASLVFSGALQDYVAIGVAIALMSSFLVAVIIALGSSIRPAIASSQEQIAVLLAGVSTQVQGDLLGEESGVVFMTFLATLALTSLTIGGLLFVFTQLRIEGFVRYLPHATICGLLTATGLLLVVESLRMLVTDGSGSASYGAIFSPAYAHMTLPALFFAASLYMIGATKRRVDVWLPALGIVAGGLFYGVYSLSGHLLADVSTSGMTVNMAAGDGRLLPSMELLNVPIRWDIVAGQIPHMLSIGVIVAIMLFVHLASLEIAMERDIDMGRELRVAGYSALAIAPFGGFPGFHSVGDILLAVKLGARRRLAGIVSGAVCIAFLAVSADVLGYVPLFIAAGFLIFLGVELVVDWFVHQYHSFHWGDVATIVAIVTAVLYSGILVGVVVGVALSLFLFIINYAQNEIVRLVITGQQVSSNVSRSDNDERSLDRHGARIKIVKIAGFLYFGSSYRLYETIVDDREESLADMEYLILDGKGISGCDSSAMNGLLRLANYLEQSAVPLALVNIDHVPELKKMVQALGHHKERDIHLFRDLDRGLEWCENRLIAAHRDDRTELLGIDVADLFGTDLSPDDLQILKEITTVQKLAEGEVLFNKDDPSDAIFLVMSGLLDAEISLEGERSLRLMSFRVGAMIGEFGYFINMNRSATVKAKEESVVGRIAYDEMRRMEETHPHVTLALVRKLSQHMAYRLVHANKSMAILQTV